MNTIHSIGIIAVAAICTMLLRAVPFIVFGGSRRIPDVIRELGSCLPPAIMATLVVYCLRGVDILEEGHGMAELISVGVVVMLHLWKRNILLTVGLGTLCYMFLIQTVFG